MPTNDADRAALLGALKHVHFYGEFYGLGDHFLRLREIPAPRHGTLHGRRDGAIAAHVGLRLKDGFISTASRLNHRDLLHARQYTTTSETLDEEIVV
jgi:hypothetical protein